ncbi:MAG: hypothetical protein OHK0052_06210 [Anaerolineales bacterium]
MKLRDFTLEHALWLLMLFLAVGLRLWGLGAAALSDTEAAAALPALQLARGVPTGGGLAPLYTTFTGALLFVFGSANFWARFAPALAGIALAGLPWFLREKLGRSAAFILAFGFIFDPGLLAIARQAGGEMLTLALTLWAAALWWRGFRPAGLALGLLALLGGVSAWFVLLAGALTLLLARFLLMSAPEGDSAPAAGAPLRLDLPRPAWIFALGLWLVAATLFLRYPQGLAEWGNSLGSFIAGWAAQPTVPIVRLPVGLLTYALLPLTFGLVAVVRVWLQPNLLGRVASVWLLVALLLWLVYPARQFAWVVWLTLPLWLLTALELRDIVSQIDSQMNRAVLGQFGLMLLLPVLFWLNLAGMGQPTITPEVWQTRVWLGLGLLFLGFFTTVLVALGWGTAAARLGTSAGLAVSLGAAVIGAAWGAAFLRPQQVQELWYAMPGNGQMPLLVETLRDFGEQKTGRALALDILSEVDTPALRWALRDFEQVRFVSVLPSQGLASALITYQPADTLEFPVAYRGQQFVLRAYPAWDGALPLGWEAWLTFRSAPTVNESLVLWLRGDVFPGGQAVGAQPAVPFPPEAPEEIVP